jgi:hypothetical protein
LKESLLNITFNNGYVSRTVVKWRIWQEFLQEIIAKTFLDLTSILINDIFSYQKHLLPQIIHFTVCSSQSNDSKIKFQKLKSHELPTTCHLFSYIKRKMRDGERERRKKEEERHEIKTEI